MFYVVFQSKNKQQFDKKWLKHICVVASEK